LGSKLRELRELFIVFVAFTFSYENYCTSASPQKNKSFPCFKLNQNIQRLYNKKVFFSLSMSDALMWQSGARESSIFVENKDEKPIILGKHRVFGS
jgi:hypothetical protein